jgi:nucleoside-diphosphate-sugar epimerase
MKILITGVAGFIGYHLATRLLVEGYEVYGVDNLNDYYDVRLKRDRLQQILPQSNFNWEYLDISDRPSVAKLFAAHKRFWFPTEYPHRPGTRKICYLVSTILLNRSQFVYYYYSLTHYG